VRGDTGFSLLQLEQERTRDDSVRQRSALPEDMNSRYAGVCATNIASASSHFGNLTADTFGARAIVRQREISADSSVAWISVVSFCFRL
jgi:hypothetical protein